jgi:cyclopropane fatty-acyl-phospholipid synthase-like methyltransferase
MNILKKKHKKIKFHWSLKPDESLKKIIKYVQKGTGLDIGAGNGRNSIFLAKKGFKMEAIDNKKEWLKTCTQYAKKYNLPIKTKIIDIKKFKFPIEKYTLVIGITSLDFLKTSEIKKILTKIKKSLKKKGIFYMVVFSIKDQTFKNLKKKGIKMIEKNTFYFPDMKIVRHYFQKKEVMNLLKDFKILRIKEEKGELLQKSHFHNTIQVIAIKK